MAALDAVNGRFGAGTLFYAGAGIRQAVGDEAGLKKPALHDRVGGAAESGGVGPRV